MKKELKVLIPVVIIAGIATTSNARSIFDVDADDGMKLEETIQIDEDTSFTIFWERYQLTNFVHTADGPAGYTEMEDEVGFFWTFKY